MSRNVGLQHFRGLRANLPTLLLGEVYFCTDTDDVFIGTSGENLRMNIPTYSTTGVLQNSIHIVSGSVTLPGGGSSVITLSGSAIFTSATSYRVTLACTNAKHSAQVTKTSGSSFTIAGSGGDAYDFICIGN